MLLTPVWAFTQTQTFSDREVQGMDSLFQVYEQNDSLQKLEIKLLKTQLVNFKTLHTQDSLHIAFMDEKSGFHYLRLYYALHKFQYLSKYFLR